MKTVRYKAAGGVVIQQGVVAGLDPERAFVLLLDRPDRNEIRLPKGHIDPGEDVSATALRETREEAGFADLVVLADLGCRTVEFDHQNIHYIRDEHYFLLTLASPATNKRPAHDAQQFHPLWVELEDASSQLTFAPEQEVVVAAVQRYRQLSK